MFEAMHAPDVTARFVRTQRALAVANDESAVLDAIAEYLEPFRPLCISMSDIHLDGETPFACVATRVWADGHVRTDHPLCAGRFPLRGAGIARRWIVSEHQPVVIDDLPSAPEAAASLRGLPAQTVVLLPLYSRRRREWLGVVSVYYDESHEPSAAEMPMYRLLLSAAAEALVHTRTERALQEALREIAELRARSRAEGRAQSRHERELPLAFAAAE